MPKKAAWPRLICPQKPVMRFSDRANSTLIPTAVTSEISYSMRRYFLANRPCGRTISTRIRKAKAMALRSSNLPR